MLHQQIGLAVTVEHAHGQLELCDPGPRVDVDVDRHARDDGDDGDDQLELFGVRAGAAWRRHSIGGTLVGWDQLDLQLLGLKMRRRRDGTWAPNKAAVRLMANVRAQTYNAADLGGLDNIGLPKWARGLWDLTSTEEKLLGALWAAYKNGTGGIYELQSTLAADLEVSERSIRHALHGRGGKSPRVGLIDRGLVRRQGTHREGTQGRGCDDSWALLRIGPVAETKGHALVFARGGRVPKSSGYTRTSARRALQRASRRAREYRRKRAGAAWRRRGGARLLTSSARPPASSSPSPRSCTLPAAATCESIPQTMPANLADKPTPGGALVPRAPSGGLQQVRGETVSPSRPPPETNELRSSRSSHVAAAGNVHDLGDGDELAGGRALASSRFRDPRWLAMHGHKPENADHVADQLARHELAVTGDDALAAIVAACARVVYGEHDAPSE